MEAEEAGAAEGLVEEAAEAGWCLRNRGEEAAEGRRSWVEEEEAGSRSRSGEAEVGGSLAGPPRGRRGAGAEEEAAGGLPQVEPEGVWAQRRVSGNLWPSRKEEEEEGTLGQEAEEEAPPSEEEEEEEEHPEKKTIKSVSSISGILGNVGRHGPAVT